MARRLSNTTDAVNIFRAGGLIATGWPVTMACWINKLSSGNGLILSIGNASSPTDWLAISINASEQVNMFTYTTDPVNLVSDALPAGLHSLVARWSSNTQRELFIDGSLAAGGTGLPSDAALSLTVTEFAVGESIDSTPSASNTTAQISQVAVWKAALTNDQVMMFARGVPPNWIRPKNLSIYLPLYGKSPEPGMAGSGYNSTNISGTTVVDEIAPIGRIARVPNAWPYHLTEEEIQNNFFLVF